MREFWWAGRGGIVKDGTRIGFVPCCILTNSSILTLPELGGAAPSVPKTTQANHWKLQEKSKSYSIRQINREKPLNAHSIRWGSGFDG